MGLIHIEPISLLLANKKENKHYSPCARAVAPIILLYQNPKI